MEKYLLTDSILSYMREKFLYDIYEEDYSLFEQSIEKEESVIVDETRRNLSFVMQEEVDVEYYKEKFRNPLKPDKKIFDTICSMVNKNENFNFLHREVLFGMPTPIPFVIATAFVKHIPIIVDEADKDYLRYQKICPSYHIEIYKKTQYLRALKGKNI